MPRRERCEIIVVSQREDGTHDRNQQDDETQPNPE
jgi:hypothetical protein